LDHWTPNRCFGHIGFRDYISVSLLNFIKEAQGAYIFYGSCNDCLLLSFILFFQKSAIAVQMSHLRQLYDDLMTSVDEELQLNPDQPVNEQVESLPYDPLFEIAIDRLTIGRMLGEGHFGRVYEGTLVGENDDDLPKTVAVKTPKGKCNADIAFLFHSRGTEKKKLYAIPKFLD
jgi:hypothetical protein